MVASPPFDPVCEVYHECAPPIGTSVWHRRPAGCASQTRNGLTEDVRGEIAPSYEAQSQRYRPGRNRPVRSTGRPRCRQRDGRVEGGAQEELELLVLNRVVSLGSPYVEDRPRPFIDTPACRPDQSFSPGGGGSRCLRRSRN